MRVYLCCRVAWRRLGSHLRASITSPVTEHVSPFFAFMPAMPLGRFGDDVGLSLGQGSTVALNTAEALANLNEAQTQARVAARGDALGGIGLPPVG